MKADIHQRVREVLISTENNQQEINRLRLNGRAANYTNPFTHALRKNCWTENLFSSTFVKLY